MYKYCTEAMVNKAVKQGREAVIKCASDKWWFFGTCTERQFKKVAFLGLNRNCALCKFLGPAIGGECDNCPCQPYCRVDYHDAVFIEDIYISNPTATNFKRFQVKARKLARVIGRLK